MTRVRMGWWLGLLGVVIFGFTLPFTRMAVGTAADPQLSGMFVAMGRATLAAVLSLGLLGLMRAPLPRRRDLPALALTALGVVFGFPLFTSIAMRHVEAVHASVMLGILPLATAAIGALLARQRPSPTFWAWSLLGAVLVILYALLRHGISTWSLHAADLLLLLATLCAALGYGFGARLSQSLGAEQVICWALVLALPLTLPLAVWSWPEHAIRAPAWFGFAYVSVFSMWVGFFAWYRGLAWGGTVRVSQVQQIQPFVSMLAAVPLLGETPDMLTLAFGLAVVATVVLGKRAPVVSPA